MGYQRRSRLRDSAAAIHGPRFNGLPAFIFGIRDVCARMITY